MTAPTAKKSQATRLVELVLERAILAHTPGGELFAVVEAAGHTENWLLRSQGFRRWATGIFQGAEARTPSSHAISDAKAVLEACAMTGSELPLHARIAQEGPETLYLDLCSPSWEVVEVHAGGWRVLKGATTPICFRRAPGMLPVPTPMAGGDISELRSFVNVARDEDFVLLVAWLVGALRGVGPYPVLVLQGEQGSAKSTVARMLRALVDPNMAPIRAEPREPRDLVIAARNGWVIALDNLSSTPAWLSDALCRLATGGGFATRALYSDDEEVIFDAQRPVILTGIDSIVSRSDLLDRAILVTLPPIPEDRRRTESELWARFETARPRLVGALLTAASQAIRARDDVRLHRLPRMADFAVWVSAAEPALPWHAGAFVSAYAGARAAANETAIEVSPVARQIINITERGPWTGTATELLEELERSLPEGRLRSRAWPRSARGLSAEIRRLAPNLRAIGIEVNFEREGHDGRRQITIERAAPDRQQRQHRQNGSESALLDADATGVPSSTVSTDRPHPTPRSGTDADGADDADGSFRLLGHENDARAALEAAGVRTWIGTDGKLWSDPPPVELGAREFDLFRRAEAEHQAARRVSTDA